jgi:hypothetical protein
VPTPPRRCASWQSCTPTCRRWRRDHVAPPLHNLGYELIQREDERLRFERELRPAWTFLVAIVLFPLGLLALLHKDRERITIDVAEDDRGTHLVATGMAPLRVRRAFAKLED